MKTLYKNLVYIATGSVLSLFLAFAASAQQHPGSGGSGSGSSGGSAASSARPSGGGSGGGASAGVSSRASGSASISRPSTGSIQHSSIQHNTSAVQRNSAYAYRATGAVNAANNGYTARQVALRGNYGYAYTPHTSINGYRTLSHVGYGKAGFWGTHGYVYHTSGAYRTDYVPQLGQKRRHLGYGFYSFFWADLDFYFWEGLYYQYDNANDDYTVVEPPIGAEIATLPENAQSIVINGVQYYEAAGVYYLPVTKDDGTIVYEVVGKDGELNTKDTNVQDAPRGPQMGDVVLKLPDECRKIKVSGQVLWVSPDGVYYQEQTDSTGNKSYKVVGLPSDETDQN